VFKWVSEWFFRLWIGPSKFNPDCYPHKKNYFSFMNICYLLQLIMIIPEWFIEISNVFVHKWLPLITQADEVKACIDMLRLSHLKKLYLKTYMRVEWMFVAHIGILKNY